MQKWVYELLYRFPLVPIDWIFGHHVIFEQLVEGGHLAPGRAIDLGCGEGSNGTIYLASKGFDVTGVDFSPTAIKRARKNALSAGVEVAFIEDNLTDLQHVDGVFDLLVDMGSLNDMNQEDRSLYMENLLPLTHEGSVFLLGCFRKKVDDREIEQRFGDNFKHEPLPVEPDPKVSSTGFVYHLMTRR